MQPAPRAPRDDAITGLDALNVIVDGYGHAWRLRRRLLAVTTPLLVPVLIAGFALDLVTAGADAPIIGGTFVLTGDDGPLSLLFIAVTVAVWLVSVTAAAIIVVGGLRGVDVGVSAALRTAARRLPYLLTGAVLLGVGAVVALLVGGAAASAVGRDVAPLGMLLLIAVVAAIAVTVARFALAVVTGALGGDVLSLTRGRVGTVAFAFLVGGVILPLLPGSLLGRSGLGWWSMLLPAAQAALAVAVVCAQAAILALLYLLRRPAVSPTPTVDATTSGTSLTAPAPHAAETDLDAVDARLRGLADDGRPPALIGLGLALPSLVVATAVLVNPYGAVRVQTSANGPSGGPDLVAWGPDGHPVVAAVGGVRFCRDDLCREYTAHYGGPPLVDGYASASLGADGTVVKTAVTGGADTGGPYIHYALCTADREDCPEAWLPTRASADEPADHPTVAATTTADGDLLFAQAVPDPVANAAGTAADVVHLRLQLIRCARATCDTPERHTLGTVDTGPNWFRQRNAVGLTVDPDGRPVITVDTDRGRHTTTCAPVTCADPEVTSGDTSGPGWLPLDLYDGRMVVNPPEPGSPWPGSMTFDGVVALAAAVSTTAIGTYAVVVEPTDAPPGLRATIGTAPEYWRYLLWYCPADDCGQPRRIPLDIVEGPIGGRVGIAVASDGRVLIVRDDRTLLLPPLR